MSAYFKAWAFAFAFLTVLVVLASGAFAFLVWEPWVVIGSATLPVLRGILVFSALIALPLSREF